MGQSEVMNDAFILRAPVEHFENGEGGAAVYIS